MIPVKEAWINIWVLGQNDEVMQDTVKITRTEKDTLRGSSIEGVFLDGLIDTMEKFDYWREQIAEGGLKPTFLVRPDYDEDVVEILDTNNVNPVWLDAPTGPGWWLRQEKDWFDRLQAYAPRYSAIEIREVGDGVFRQWTSGWEGIHGKWLGPLEVEL